MPNLKPKLDVETDRQLSKSLKRNSSSSAHIGLEQAYLKIWNNFAYPVSIFQNENSFWWTKQQQQQQQTKSNQSENIEWCRRHFYISNFESSWANFFWPLKVYQNGWFQMIVYWLLTTSVAFTEEILRV